MELHNSLPEGKIDGVVLIRFYLYADVFNVIFCHRQIVGGVKILCDDVSVRSLYVHDSQERCVSVTYQLRTYNVTLTVEVVESCLYIRRIGCHPLSKRVPF